MQDKNNINPRVMLTKRLIRESLLEMLKTRNIKKISILELCKIAGINRTTFYNHYGSQYDVLNEMAEDYIKSTSFAVMNDIAKGKNFNDCFIKVLQYMKDNREFAKLLLDADNYDLIAHIKISLPNFDDILVGRLPQNLDIDERRAIASFVQYGTVRLLKEWILCDCLKSVEEEAQLILGVVGRAMGGFRV